MSHNDNLRGYRCCFAQTPLIFCVGHNCSLTDYTQKLRRESGALPHDSIAAFLKDETAATAIEYGLIAAGIAVAIIAVITGLGTQLNSSFTNLSNQIK
jgi:pilus assembly protein Flp/PilA